MKKWSLLLAVPALVAITVPARAAADDPDAVLWQIRAENAKRLQEQPPDIAAIIKTRAVTSKAAVKGVDPAAVKPAKALAWAQLYFFAEEYEGARTAARRSFTSSPAPEAVSMAQHIVIESSLRMGDAQALLATITKIKPPSPRAAARIAAMAGAELAGVVADKLGTQAGLDLLTKAEALVPFDQLTAGMDKTLVDQTRASLAAGRADLLSGDGKHAEALAALKTMRWKLADGGPAARQIDTKLKQTALVGRVAPPIARERGYGDFAGLESLRGKVVLVDFTTHWGPSCKQSYPAVRKMYDELKGKGLEVVGVTTYFGFFGNERGISEDQEFAKLADHVKEHNITWPVVVGPKSNPAAYGVNTSAHYVVLGRDGKVVSYTAGYSAELFSRLRADVEKSLAQPTAASDPAAR